VSGATFPPKADLSAKGGEVLFVLFFVIPAEAGIQFFCIQYSLISAIGPPAAD